VPAQIYADTATTVSCAPMTVMMFAVQRRR
jgi:hypothetical protein